MKRLLVTGAAGKVGSQVIRRILQPGDRRGMTIRALCHNRLLSPQEGLETVRGSIADREVVREAMQA
jgi:UDP-glucose 4-epimerase